MSTSLIRRIGRARLPLGVAAAAALGLAVAYFAPKEPLAPDIRLTNQDGRAWSLAAHRGRAVAIFFGYTHCPDVCPTTLADLAAARRRLGPGGARWDVVFITVDPARDGPAQVRSYVRQFDPAFTGLTGSDAEVERTVGAFHVFRKKLEAPGSAAGYLYAHSSVVQFIAPTGRIAAFADWSDGVDRLTATMKDIAS